MVPMKSATKRFRRVAIDLLGGADLFDSPGIHHRDPVRHRQRLLLRVGDEDEGDADLALQRDQFA